ncbi:MAG: S8 family peptidase [Bacteroidetes bacterium]|nr:S8 family peptidase [Bacteroidota bacterium]
MVENSVTSDDVVKTTWEYIPGQYIIVYDKAQIGNPQQKIGKNPVALHDYVQGVTNQMFEQHGISAAAEIKEIYCNTINGFAASLTNEQLEKIKKDARVAYVEQDIMIHISGGKPGSGTTQPAQVIKWNMLRVNWATYAGSNVCFILDTGIDLNHPDLNVDAKKGFNAFRTGIDAKSLNDGHGHGSHCAGVVGAKNNDIGVVGVAAGATVVPVKVLSNTGSGSYSGVIAGVDFVAAHATTGDVASMSLGGPIYTPLDDAIKTAAANGIKFALAAGNEGDDANNHSPARTNATNVYTISAMDVNDNYASWSNWSASIVDYCAPGVSIYSTYKNDGYTTMSGTSMATPHAAGVLLHGTINTSGTVNNDPDGTSDPIIVH